MHLYYTDPEPMHALLLRVDQNLKYCSKDAIAAKTIALDVSGIATIGCNSVSEMTRKCHGHGHTLSGFAAMRADGCLQYFHVRCKAANFSTDDQVPLEPAENVQYCTNIAAKCCSGEGAST